MPWSITVSCIVIVLVLCRLCDKILNALKTPMWLACIYLFLIALCRLLPAININDYVIIKPYASLLFIIATAYLLSDMKRAETVRSIAGSVLCALIYLIMMYLIPPETLPVMLSAFPVAAMAFALGYTANATLVCILLSTVTAELAYSLMYLPFVEFGTGEFLDSASISSFVALTVSRILAHNKLAERRRKVTDRIAPLCGNHLETKQK